MPNDYEGYFKNHYKSALSQTDIELYRKWFYAQWKYIKKHVAVKPSLRVLEIGSGFGGFYTFLQDEGVQNYVGLEVDAEAASFANRHFTTDIFRVESIENFEDTDGFDLIFAFEVLEHLQNPSAALIKIHALLRPGGVFCGTTPYPYAKNVYADNTHLSVLHPANWHRLLKRAQFTDIRLHPMSFPPIIWRISKSANVRIPSYVPFKGFISTCLCIATK